MTKYKVLKNFVNPWGTQMDTTCEIGTDISASNITVEYSDTDLADPKIKAVVDAALADGAIVELVAETPAPTSKMVDYVVSGTTPVANPDTQEVFQPGNVMQFPEGSEIAAQFVTTGLIMLKSDYDAKQSTQEQQDTKATPAETPAPTATDDGEPKEPRLRYRGKLVVDETKRTVGSQTFRHISLENGEEIDLNDREYAGEVHLSYPSQA